MHNTTVRPNNKTDAIHSLYLQTLSATLPMTIPAITSKNPKQVNTIDDIDSFLLSSFFYSSLKVLSIIVVKNPEYKATTAPE